jgi:hypothetical protein
MPRELTEQKLLQLLRSALRRASVRWPPKNAAKYAARVEQMVNPLTGRVGWFSECAQCHSLVPEKFVQADHVVPVGSMKRETIGEQAVRMFPFSSSEYQILCKGCHSAKTYFERYGKHKGIAKAKVVRKRRGTNKGVRNARRTPKSRK